jgi:hypothetical protein
VVNHFHRRFVVSTATNGSCSNESWLNTIIGASNDVGSYEAIANALASISTITVT